MGFGFIAGVLRQRRTLRKHERWSRTALESHRAASLAELRRWANERSPFYRRFHAGCESRPLAELPVLTKTQLMESFDELVTDRGVRLGSTEDWEFRNLGGMMTMAHPIHIHAGQFQVLEREVAPQWQAAADTLRAGLVTEGWKDTFLLLPGERVRLRMRFERYAGLFLYHCHNLEHEDAGMMRNFLIEA